MVNALQHRGPDASGLYRDPSVGLVHARLAIIDLATGDQPMSNEDGTTWLVFNGEIFNYIELRAELLASGYRFRTTSDTEVVIRAWEAWGEAAFERFNGQFAIALWDSRAEVLVLARDRLGVRPLYVTEHAGRVWFASEVKAIFAGDRSIPRAFDPSGFAETFTFWSTVAPQTVFLGVTEIEPGHVRIVGRNGTTDRAYWSADYTDESMRDPVPTDKLAERVLEALTDAVRLRMIRSDVPVGSYLSGGLDSSLIAALGRQVKGERFSTFSVRFEDAEFDETSFQRSMVAAIGSEHHELLVRRADIAEVFPQVVFHAERPLLRTAPAPMFLLSRLVHETGVKVVLTGEGADEMFGGYDLFREGKVRRFWGRRPESTLRPRLLERLYPYLERSPVAQRDMAREFFGRDIINWSHPGFAHQTRWRTAAATQRLFDPGFRAEAGREDVVARLIGGLPTEFGTWSPLAQDQFLEVHTLLAGYILSSQGDRMLMANSVEGRFPFLDVDVVRFANGLPASAKLRGLDEKYVLKLAAVGLVPEAIIRRPKQPYRAPDAVSFIGEAIPDWVAAAVDPRAVKEAGVFDSDGVRRLMGKCARSAADGPLSNGDNMALVGVLSTGLLFDLLVRRDPRDSKPVPFQTYVDRLQIPHDERPVAH